MAFLDATLWNDLQPTQGQDEKRYAELGIINAVKASSQYLDYLSPAGREALSVASSLRNVDFPVIKDQSVTVVTTPGFANIPSNLPESAQYNFTAYDVFSGFRFYPAAYANNQVNAEWERNNRMLKIAYACGNSIETILATVLNSRKTQVLGYTTQVSQGDGVYSFNTTPDELEISKAAQKETMFANINQLFDSNEIPGMLRYVTSRAGMAVQLTELLKYGSNNDKNLQALGFPTADRIHQSGNISAGSDVFNGYVFRDGAIGMIENYPYDFVAGTKIQGKEWYVSDMELPFAKLRANIFVDTQAAEGTSLVSAGEDSNLIMTHFEEMAIWFRFYVVYPYNSDLSTRVNDIVKISGKTS